MLARCAQQQADKALNDRLVAMVLYLMMLLPRSTTYSNARCDATVEVQDRCSFEIDHIAQ